MTSIDDDPFTENQQPREQPLTLAKREAEKSALRRWVIVGLGALIALTIILSFILVAIQPTLGEYVLKLSQPVLSGLIGLAGSAVGFLFARSEG